MPVLVKIPKKLVEVALPLDVINKSAIREKSIRHGHPSMIHLWWARRPLAVARAIIFAQMVNDPSWKWEIENPGLAPPGNLKASWAASRKRLFRILEDLVQWENTTNESVLEKARAEIRKSWHETCALNQDHPHAKTLFNPDVLPGFHDPFAGGGALPLEAQRLGLAPFASDLNPVAVLINKGMIDYPARFSGLRPINPDWQNTSPEEKVLRQWSGAQGLANDVQFYGKRIQEEAKKRIDHFFPPITVPQGSKNPRSHSSTTNKHEANVIAWIWARTVKSPNPAFSDVAVPLISTYILSSKPGNEYYIEPVISGKTYSFRAVKGIPEEYDKFAAGTKTATRANFRCIISGAPISGDHIKSEGSAGRLGQKLIAIVVDSGKGRAYISPSEEAETIALSAKAAWKPEGEMVKDARAFTPFLYGMNRWSDLFTDRQLLALTTFSDLIDEVRQAIKKDADSFFSSSDSQLSKNHKLAASQYADAIATYLAFVLDKCSDYWSSICTWHNSRETIGHTFGRQALPMTWDFCEANPFSDSSGNWIGMLDWLCKSLALMPANIVGEAHQIDAQTQSLSNLKVVSTDPPYYDNIPYADLSDYFYVWIRKTLSGVYPSLLSTLAVPKAEELVAKRYLHGTKQQAEAFFLSGMTLAMHQISSLSHPAFPVTIYYAFKQSENRDNIGTTSTGWETFLEAILKSGLAIKGTWPVRTELGNRKRGMKSNALASSIVLVCSIRDINAPTISRRQFQREINSVLPGALDEMTKGLGDDQSPVAPVDLSQAIIGPGMAVFSKYAAVLEADGSSMPIKTALQLINRFLAGDDFDPDTRFCLDWFEQHGWSNGQFGAADTLARSKGTAVDGVKAAGVIFASSGVVRLLKWSEYPSDWTPLTETRLPIWGVLHRIINAFKTGGETSAGVLLAVVASKSETVRQLAYRLYTLCERAGWPEDARAYNEIITSWNAIESAAELTPSLSQGSLFDA